MELNPFFDSTVAVLSKIDRSSVVSYVSYGRLCSILCE